MWILKLIAVLGLIYLAGALPVDNASLETTTTTTTSTVSLIEDHGYPVEVHHVTTSDGYILEMHRIPFAPQNEINATTNRPVAFIMHGLLCSSADYVLTGPGKGLAYILADEGYDVWMANARGNTYSKNHIKKSPSLKSFWNFSWHEISIIDVPEMIDYVLKSTGEEKVHYIGHSQGTTNFFILNSELPELTSRTIKSSHMLAPVVFMDHIQSPFIKVGGPLLGQPNPAVEIFGTAEFLPSSRALELLGAALCREQSLVKEVCTNVLFLLAGWDSPYLNTSLIPEIATISPAGASVNQVAHYMQEYNSGYFRQFDYGSIRNRLEYGDRQPPNYNLDQLNAPTYLYYSDNDYLASEIDIERLIYALPAESLKGAYKVPAHGWNHIDFTWGMEAKELVYDQLIADMRNA